MASFGTGAGKGSLPRAVDLTKSGKNLSKAFGKPEVNELIRCKKCGHRHWTHQSCIDLK